MIRLVRIIGIVLMAVGVIVILTWLIEPLREVLPAILDGFRSLPITIQIGLTLAAIGFLLLFATVVWERVEDRKSEGNLLDED